MAPVAPEAGQASVLLQKLSLDSQPNTRNSVELTEQAPTAHNGSSNDGAPQFLTSSDRSFTPVMPEFVDPTNCYVPGYASPAYFYGGYDHAACDWGDYSRHTNQDQAQGVYGKVYQGYGYAPYSAYPSNGSAVPTMGHEGQLYGQHQYQYPVPFFQPNPPISTTQMSNPPMLQGEASISVVSDQPSMPADIAKTLGEASNGDSNVNNGIATKSIHQNPSPTLNAAFGRGGLPGGVQSTGYHDPWFNFNGMWSSVAWYDGPLYTNVSQRPTNSPLSSTPAYNVNNSSLRNRNQQPVPNIMGIHTSRQSGTGHSSPAISRVFQTNNFYGGSGHGNRFAYGFGCANWGLVADSKYKPRGRGNIPLGCINQDGFSELNRGPRAGRIKSHKVSGSSTIGSKNQNQSLVGNELSKVSLQWDQYNREDHPEKYSEAKFFIIKSYSEDDVHKCIEYNVWTSTPNGNKKLEAAYREAQEKTGGCPVFLFFSVNASGQFIGVAEMVGPVDFNKTFEYWQQDKWTGCFPVKWHIIKDVPNRFLKHIILENNENKPVTNSRDTQEVNLEQGLQMLKIFKEHVSKTSVLDDFEFYENRQRLMQEKRGKQQLQKQVWGDKTSLVPADSAKEDANEKHLPHSNSMLDKAVYGIIAVADDSLNAKNPTAGNHGVTNVVSDCELFKYDAVG